MFPFRRHGFFCAIRQKTKKTERQLRGRPLAPALRSRGRHRSCQGRYWGSSILGEVEAPVLLHEREVKEIILYRKAASWAPSGSRVTQSWKASELPGQVLGLVHPRRS
jgi:hypothetical protein